MAANENILLRGGRVLNPSATAAEDLNMETDIRIANGAVSEIKAKLKHRPGEIEIDASGLWILPGFIDLHTHLRDLGQSDQKRSLRAQELQPQVVTQLSSRWPTPIHLQTALWSWVASVS